MKIAKIKKWTPAQKIGAGVGLFVIGRLVYKAFSTHDIADTGNSQDLPVTGKLTYNEAMYRGLADGIQAAFWSGTGWTEDDTAIGTALKQMYTDADVQKLVSTYGARGGFLLGSALNLPQTVTAYLDNDVKTEVNNDYQKKGIQYRWL
jgi:hypothetical protein